ncbi:MAG: hypothetical protein LBQ50_03825, partial [Planctomycetaceae bacterium]|nr:hypothetical protein [Planctomycetaceae bacterium]
MTISPAIPVTRELVHNSTTVYNNMREAGNSRIKSATVAVASQAARLTGVENVSYAWDGTDPVTGEQYSAGWRAAYTVLGAGELVASAFGIKGIAEGIIGSAKSLLKKPSSTPILKGGCFLAGTLVSRYHTDTIDKKELVGIENIKSGDLVWACNPRFGTW